jgi:hypothetical protein
MGNKRRFLCANGHLWQQHNDEDQMNCPICRKPSVWQDEKFRKRLVIDHYDKLEKTSVFGEIYHERIPIYVIPGKQKQDPNEMIGYVAVRPFDEYDVGEKFYFRDSDGVTSYVDAPNKDSSLIPTWLCDALTDYFGILRRKDIKKTCKSSYSQ